MRGWGAPTMVEATGKLAQWRLRLSDFEFDIVHRTSMKNQGAEALSGVKKKGEDKTTRHDEVAVLTIYPEIFACVSQTGITNFEVIEELKVHLFPLFSKSA